MKFHKNGSRPENGEIFVFGSNLGGIHGAGAALAARQLYGAQLYVGVGPTGMAYAIPTKNEDITRSLPLKVIKAYVDQFIEYAKLSQDAVIDPRNAQQFFVTAIGCGLAGYKHADIAPMFKGAPSNVSLPEDWRPYV